MYFCTIAAVLSTFAIDYKHSCSEWKCTTLLLICIYVFVYMSLFSVFAFSD